MAPSLTVSAQQTSRRTVQVQATLDTAVAAVRRGDRPAFDALFVSPVGPFADQLFGNLTVLPAGGLQLRAEAQTADLPVARRAELQGGWAQRVRVSSRLGNDTGPALYRVWLAVVPGPHGARLAGTTQGPGEAPVRRPLWLIQPVRLITGPRASVLGAGRIDLGNWLRRAERAEAAVRSRLDGLGPGRWSGGLVLELPSSEGAFEQVLGVEPGSYRRIAAVAWPEGPDPASAALRVVVNPTPARSLNDDQLAVLLTHEATHVVTRAAASPAPMWLAEGFADWVAFDDVPAAARPTENLVLDDVRRHGAPAGFPTDDDFRPDADDLDLTYARSWMLCRFIAESWSAGDLVRLYAEVDGQTPVPAAMSDALGIEPPRLLDRWRAWLERRARR
jgi:hypothetical protein